MTPHAETQISMGTVVPMLYSPIRYKPIPILYNQMAFPEFPSDVILPEVLFSPILSRLRAWKPCASLDPYNSDLLPHIQASQLLCFHIISLFGL